MAQLYPQAPGTHFSRLLRHAWVTVELFLFPGHHTGSNSMLVGLIEELLERLVWWRNPLLLWNAVFIYSAHKRLPVDLILSQLNQWISLYEASLLLLTTGVADLAETVYGCQTIENLEAPICLSVCLSVCLTQGPGVVATKLFPRSPTMREIFRFGGWVVIREALARLRHSWEVERSSRTDCHLQFQAQDTPIFSGKNQSSSWAPDGACVLGK
jgi:hypothetical protein